ncbi:FCD domain-containing protein [Parafrankia sp. FMc6]|uniref:FCD domain-containing protein n=1 Tax=Parafrankia soli TaxID=2599596 RepID=UPI0034D73EE6
MLRRDEVSDVHEVRMLVEMRAARLAAQRRTGADVAALHKALEGRRIAAAGKDDTAFVDADIALHTAVGDAAHAALVDAVAARDGERAGDILRAELDQTLALLRAPTR